MAERGIDAAEFTFCTIDDKLIEESPAYQFLVKTCGEEYANTHTETVIVPLRFDHAMQGSDELQYCVQVATGGYKPGKAV